MVLLIATPVPDQRDQVVEQVRDFTRLVEFDYINWTLNAFSVKWQEAARSTSDYLSLDEQRQVVLQALDLVQQVQIAEAQISLIYTDPNITDPESQAASIRTKLDNLHQQQQELNPIAEDILQDMVADTYHAAALGIDRFAARGNPPGCQYFPGNRIQPGKADRPGKKGR